MHKFDRRSLSYQFAFCEENVWKLLDTLLASDRADLKLDDSYVLFWINPTETVWIKNQLAFQGAHGGIWDYHVVLMATEIVPQSSVDHSRESSGRSQWVFDFDSTLPFPVPLETYLRESFNDQSNLDSRLRAMVRVIPALAYHRRFSSNRSHMLDPSGHPISEFPPWPCIESGEPIDLKEYRDVNAELKDGSRVIQLSELIG